MRDRRLTTLRQTLISHPNAHGEARKTKWLPLTGGKNKSTRSSDFGEGETRLLKRTLHDSPPVSLPV